MMSVEERQRELRAELKQLDGADHPLALEEKHQAYIDGLKREKAMAEQTLEGARAHDPDDRERLHSDRDNPNSLAYARRTWGERAAELERTVAAIDLELERVHPLA